MQFRTWKFGLLAVLLVAMAIVVGCQSELERAAEATVEVQQQNIEDFFTVIETQVAAATQLAGGLPSQEAKGDLLLQDLEEIQRRLNEAVEMEAEAKVTALEAVQQQVETVKGNVETTLEEAIDQLPEEAQDALEQLRTELEEMQKNIQNEIDAVKTELGQEVEEAQEAAEDAAEGAEEEAEATAEAVEEAMGEVEATAEATEEETEEASSSD